MLKKIQVRWVLFYTLITLPFILINCNQNSNICAECEKDFESFEQQKLPSKLSNVQLAELVIPEGTEATYLNPNEVSFSLPDGYYVVTKNDENYALKSGEMRYQCTCTGSGCNVVLFPGGDSQPDQVGCSACTSACTGKWVEPEKNKVDSSIIEYVDIINMNLDISIIETLNKPIPCGEKFDANWLFIIKDLNKELNDFFAKNNLEIWDGVSENYASLPIQAFGKSIVLRFNDNNSEALKNAYSELNILPTCNCDSGNEGCEYQAITHKPCNICPPITIGHQCNSGVCISCSMIIPE